MGSTFSRPASRSNRVSSAIGHQSGNSTAESEVEIRIPDATSRQKVKSKSFHLPLSKSFKKGASSVSPLSSSNVRRDEIEVARQEYKIEKLKLDYETQIEELKKDRERLHEENSRLRNEVKVLNAALPKLRAEKEKAHHAERDAVERATALEQEKDKTQRQFKMYREAKEQEVQALLKKQQSLTTQLRKYLNTDGSVQDFLVDGADGCHHSQSISEWLLDSQSVADVYFREKQYGGELVESSLFIDIKNDRDICSDLRSLLSSLHNIEYGVPKTNVYSVYVTFTEDMVDAANLFMNLCRKLILEFEQHERVLEICPVPWSLKDQQTVYESVTCDYFQHCDVVVALIGSENISEIISSIFDDENNHSKQYIFGSIEEQALKEMQKWSSGLKYLLKLHHYICGFDDVQSLVCGCLNSLTSICMLFMEKQLHRTELEKERIYEKSFCENYALSSSLDILDVDEQQSIQDNFYKRDGSVSIEEEIKMLNNYIMQDGPVQPLLLTGEPGCGKSFLLAHWVGYLRKSLSDSCVLYHVASIGSPDSRSICHVLRRFIFFLLDKLPATFNAIQLEKEFTRHLEKACVKYSNRIVIVIDGADLLDGKDDIKWLLDPLFFPVRVVISVSNESYPEKWRSWPQLVLSNEDENPAEMFRLIFKNAVNELQIDTLIKTAFPDGILPRRARLNLSNHLFRELCGILINNESSLEDMGQLLKECIVDNTLTDLFYSIIEYLQLSYDQHLLNEILLFLLVSHTGILLMELDELLVEWKLLDILQLLSVLIKYQLVVKISGLYQLARTQVKEAVMKNFNIFSKSKEHSFRNRLISLFLERFRENNITYRAAGELPWQLVKVSRKEDLSMCMASIHMFRLLYWKGRFSSIVDYWRYLGKDVKGIYDVYATIFEDLEKSDEFNEMLVITLDMLGEFALDQGLYRFAHQSFEKSLDLKETHFEADDMRIGYSICSLGRLFMQWKKFQTAEDYFNQALELKNHHGQADTIQCAKCLECLASLYLVQDRNDSAKSCQKQALKIRQVHCNEKTMMKMKNYISELRNCIYTLMEEYDYSEEMGNYLLEIGDLYFNIHNFQDAAEVYFQALELLAKSYGKQHSTVAYVMCKLSSVFQVLEEHGKAGEYLEEALVILLQNESIDDSYVQKALKNLFKILKKEEKFDRIESWYRKVLTIQKEVIGDSSPAVANLSNALGVHLSKMKNFTEAMDFYHQSLMIYSNHFGFQDGNVTEVLSNMAKTLYEEGKHNIAAEMYRISMDANRTLEQV